MRFKVMSLCLFLALLPFIVACPHGINPQKAEEAALRYRAAEKFFSSGENVAALAEAIKAVELVPDKYEYRLLAGRVYFAKKLYKEALVEFNAAMKINPKNADTHMHVGDVYMEMKEWDGAIAHYDMALENVFFMAPELALNNKGWAYYNKGDYKKAIDLYEKAGVKGNFALPVFNAGLAYDKLGKYKEAAESYKKVIAIEPNSAEAYYQLGLVSVRGKNKEEARRAFQKVLELAPGGERASSAKDYLDLLKK